MLDEIVNKSKISFKIISKIAIVLASVVVVVVLLLPLFLIFSRFAVRKLEYKYAVNR